MVKMDRFAFITDVHLNEEYPLKQGVNAYSNFEKILDDIKKKNIRTIVFGGDIGNKSAHTYFFNALKDFDLKLILGNHDCYSEVKSSYNVGTHEHELFYHLESLYYKYLFLDTSKNFISNNQLKWINDQLKTNKKIIIFSHHPIFKIDTIIDSMFPLQNRDEVQKILNKSQKQITVFCGHYHMKNNGSFKNVRQITSYAISYQIKKNAMNIEPDNTIFGYIIIDATGSQLKIEYVNLS